MTVLINAKTISVSKTILQKNGYGFNELENIKTAPVTSVIISSKMVYQCKRCSGVTCRWLGSLAPQAVVVVESLWQPAPSQKLHVQTVPTYITGAGTGQRGVPSDCSYTHSSTSTASAGRHKQEKKKHKDQKKNKKEQQTQDAEVPAEVEGKSPRNESCTSSRSNTPKPQHRHTRE